MVRKPGNPIPNSRKPAPRRVCAERNSSMLDQANTRVAGSSQVPAAPPLSVRLSGILETARNARHLLEVLENRTFGCEPVPLPVTGSASSIGLVREDTIENTIGDLYSVISAMDARLNALSIRI